MQHLRGFQLGRILGALLVSALISRTTLADTGDPALDGNHPLTQAQAGDVLIGELRCAACHGGIDQTRTHAKAAPDLLNAGARISPDYLKRFLASPSVFQPGTTMPDMMASLAEPERNKIAEALTHFLVAQSKLTYQPSPPEQ